MKHSLTPTDLRKKAISLLEKIEGHPRIVLERKDSDLDLLMRKHLKNKNSASQSGYSVKQTHRYKLPGLASRKVTESFRSENDGSLVFRSQAGNLVVPRLTFERSPDHDGYWHKFNEVGVEDRVKDLRARCKELQFNFGNFRTRRLKQKVQSPSLLERKTVQRYEKIELSPTQNVLIQKWNEKFNDA